MSPFAANIVLKSNSNSDVDRRSTRAAQNGDSRVGEPKLSFAVGETAAETLLEANRQLQQDLATVQQELEAQRRQLDSYRAEALTDALTGLANRRKFDRELKRCVAEWKARGTALSLMLVDVDHFKLLNDEHGHAGGDAILHELAQVLLGNVRSDDLVARYGGEEFGIILPGTTLNEACPVAERIRFAIARHTFQFGDDAASVTVSAGVVQAALTNDSESLVEQADMALYAAKHSGRDCCHVYDGQSSTICYREVASSR
jgi:diguanylate cyclase